MTEFRTVSTHDTISSAEYNALLDHGLEKTASYIIRQSGSYYEAVNGTTGKISYGGSTDVGGADGTDQDAVTQAAVDALSSGGTVLLKELQLGSVTYGNTILIVEEYQGSHKVYSNLGLWLLPHLASDPSTGGWGASEKGRRWFNTTANKIKFWDGSAVQTVPGVGGGGTTVYSGTASGSSPITVAHGIGSEPSYVVVSANALQPYALAYNKDATNIYIYHNAAGSLTVSYLAFV